MRSLCTEAFIWPEADLVINFNELYLFSFPCAELRALLWYRYSVIIIFLTGNSLREVKLTQLIQLEPLETTFASLLTMYKVLSIYLLQLRSYLCEYTFVYS